MTNSYLQLLSKNGTKKLFSLICFVSFAEFFLESLVYVWIVSSTSSNHSLQAILLGFNVFCSTVPRILGAALLGVVADRIGARKSFVFSSLSRAIICLSLLIIFGSSGDALLVLSICMLICITGLSTLNQLFLSARAQSIQELVSKSLRPVASSFSMVLLTGVSIASSAAAPFIFEIAGIIPCLVIVFLSFAVASVISYSIPSESSQQPKNLANPGLYRFFNELIAGWRICWQVKSLRMVLLGSVVYGIPMGINNIALILLWVEHKQVSFSGYGFASALFGIGGFVGAVMAPILSKKNSTNSIYVISLISLGAAYVLLGLIDNLPISFLLMFCSGLLFSVFAVLQSPILLDSSPSELTGRVVSTTNAATALSSLIASMCVSGIFATFSLRPTMYGFAVSAGGVLVILGGLLLGRSIFRARELRDSSHLQ